MLPEGGASQPRLHAPVKSSVRDFLQQQLYGKGAKRRAPAATLSSLKPPGGRGGAALNFASVPLDASASGRKRKRSKRSGAGAAREAIPGRSTLEEMAARIMQRGKS